MKHKVPGFFTNNIGLKFMSLLIAFIIWEIVSNIDNPVKSVLFRNVPIQVVNEDSVTDIDKVFDIVSEQNVIIKATEKKSVLNSLAKDGSDFTVIADMENLTPMGTVPLTVLCSSPSVTIDEIEVVPSSMKVQLEQKKQSEFVVNVSAIGQQRGYEVGKTEILQGKTVQIAGPESMVNKIGQVVATANLAQLHDNQQMICSLSVYDKNGDLFTENQMSRLQIKDSAGVPLNDNQVTVVVTMWKLINNVRLEIGTTGTPAKGYRLDEVTALPAEENLVGSEEAIERLNGKLVLSDIIDIQEKTESFVTEINLEDTLAEIEDIRMASDSDPNVSVTVKIEEIGSQTLGVPLSALEILHKPEKMNLTFSPADIVNITVRSDLDDSAELRLEDIKASIDLKECTEPGIYDIPIQVELPDNYSMVDEPFLVVTAEEADSKTEQLKATAADEEEE